MALCAIATLCRFFRQAHHKSGAKCHAFQNRNIMAGMARARCGLCRMGRRLRNGVTAAWGGGFRYTVLKGHVSEGQHRGMRGILCGLFLCSAFALLDARAAEPSEEMIARGKVLAVAGDCASCHTADPAKPFAGGKRIDTPFGAIYSPNLTPDRDTGIGAWSEQEFYRALRLGVAPDGSLYYPAFPYPNFSKMTRDDISRRARLSRNAGADREQGPAAGFTLPAEFSRRDARLEFPVLPAGHSGARPAEGHGLESGPAIWSRGPAIAAPATRRRTSLAPTSAASVLPAARSTAISRRGSMRPRAAG